MDTPQTFDHDPRARGGAGRRTTTIHTDPPPGPNPNPTGGRRNMVKLSMKERQRRRSKASVKGTHLDPAVLQAKAIVDAAGALTHEQEIDLRLQRIQERKDAQRALALEKLKGSSSAARANALRKARARAERALDQQGLPVTTEYLALLMGAEEEQESRLAGLPDNLRSTDRPGQNITKAPSSGVMDETQMEEYGGAPVPMPVEPPSQVLDETREFPEDSFQERLAAELAAERAAIEAGQQEFDFPEDPEDAVANAKAQLEALGYEVSLAEPAPEGTAGDAETDEEEALSTPEGESPGASGTEAAQ